MDFSDSRPKSDAKAIGLHWLIEELGLGVVRPQKLIDLFPAQFSQ